MITAVNVKNYKAFKDATIEIKPITIFLGANSVGKSSMIKLLLMIAQNSNSIDTINTALKINSETIDLGSYENIMHKKKTNNTLEVSFAIDNIDINRQYSLILNSLTRTIKDLKKVYAIYYSNAKSIEDITREIDKQYQDLEINIDLVLKEITSYKIRINNLIKKDSRKESSFIFKLKTIYFPDTDDYYINHLRHTFIKNVDGLLQIDTKSLKTTYSYFKELKQFHGEKIEVNYSFKLSKNKKVINITKFSIFSKSINLFTYEKIGISHSINTNLIDNKELKSFSSLFRKSVTLNQFQIKKTNYNKSNYFIENLYNCISNIVSNITNTFNYSNINYVDPLRSYPRRYYFLDEKKDFNALSNIDGHKMATILKENNELKKKVNKWIDKFNLKVSIEQLKDAIHNIKITQNNLNLDITDVGFGISQVLPIITQSFLSDKNSITLIEQPEIHLHPKMQAELADLFIEVVKENVEFNKRIIIETHSEYLLKRLRRRISEGQIKNTDVAIYSFSLNDNTKIGSIKKIEIEEKGEFPWPKDFYDTEMDDTYNFLLNQDVEEDI